MRKIQILKGCSHKGDVNNTSNGSRMLFDAISPYVWWTERKHIVLCSRYWFLNKYCGWRRHCRSIYTSIYRRLVLSFNHFCGYFVQFKSLGKGLQFTILLCGANSVSSLRNKNCSFTSIRAHWNRRYQNLYYDSKYRLQPKSSLNNVE
jgi:hypothetical protein